MRQLAILGFGAVLAGGCGGSGDATPDTIDLSAYNCATETRADVFTVGMEKTGAAGLLDFKLMTANPAPPARCDSTGDCAGNNDWVIEIDTHASSAPVNGLGATTLKVSPYMPDHQHGPGIKADVMAMPTSGQYDLYPVNLWMPGLWETTISVEAADGTKDHAVFSFCLAS